MKSTAKRIARNVAHRQLTRAGVPRAKDGNRLGLRKRRQIWEAQGQMTSAK